MTKKSDKAQFLFVIPDIKTMFVIFFLIVKIYTFLVRVAYKILVKIPMKSALVNKIRKPLMPHTKK